MTDQQPIPAFMWGVATSAYQCEGGYNGAGEPQTNWAWAERAGDVARSGKAAEFWTRYEEDFDRAQNLGLKAFRLGIEWSRVQPSTELEQFTEPPPFDLAALDHYADIIEAAVRRGLEPIVTLHHFVHPGWLGRDPWLSRGSPDLFREFVVTTLDHINKRLVKPGRARPIRFFITINEPNMLVLNTYAGNQFPSGTGRGLKQVWQAYSQLFRAHVIAYNAIHDLYEERGWDRPLITTNNYCSDLYWSDKLWLDLLSVRRRNVAREDVQAYVCAEAARFRKAFAAAALPLRRDLPYHIGNLVKRISEWFGSRFFDVSKIESLLDTIYESKRQTLFDYVGLDYYDPFAAHVFRLPVWWDHEFKNKSVTAWLMNSVTSKWWDWRVLPHGMHFFCELYHRAYRMPLLIAENGMAIRRRRGEPGKRRRDRMARSEFLRLHVDEVNRIREQGLPLIGYLHWSLFDNYEWGTYTPRFGLFRIDFERNTDRMAIDEDGDQPSRTYADLIAESKL
ncbi:MAG: family 1 glycosylhydrolase [Chthoniobacterales bacterium]